MNKLLLSPIALALLLRAPVSLAQAASAPPVENGPSAQPAPATDAASIAIAPSAPPSTAPPGLPPAASIPEPPPQVADPPAAAEVAPPAGQWTYTSQYGWLWLPYDQSYTYVYAGSDVSYEYAYYPAYGWRWVASPWVFGLGPAPYWGARGRVGFAWYAHPWFHSGVGYRGGSYRAAHDGTVRGSQAFHGGAQVSHGGGGHGRR
jgi:hypothetical protein